MRIDASDDLSCYVPSIISTSWMRLPYVSSKTAILRGKRARLRRSKSEPGGQCVSEPRLGRVSHPGHISVGPDQHGLGSRDGAKHWKLPHAITFGVDNSDPIRPWRDVEAAGVTQIEQHRPGLVQQGVD